MKDLINWHELSRRLSGNGQNIRPNDIPKKYESKVNRLLKIIEVWERWQKNKATNNIATHNSVWVGYSKDLIPNEDFFYFFEG